MKISNLRKVITDAHAILEADIECSFSKSSTILFKVPVQYSEWLTDDVYDALLVGMIWPAMCYGEDIEIDGEVSKSIYFHITSYLIPLLKQFSPHYQGMAVKVK